MIKHDVDAPWDNVVSPPADVAASGSLVSIPLLTDVEAPISAPLPPCCAGNVRNCTSGPSPTPVPYLNISVACGLPSLHDGNLNEERAFREAPVPCMASGVTASRRRRMRVSFAVLFSIPVDPIPQISSEMLDHNGVNTDGFCELRPVHFPLKTSGIMFSVTRVYFGSFSHRGQAIDPSVGDFPKSDCSKGTSDQNS